MSGKRSTRGNRYGAEVRSATVALVDKLRPQYPSLWATIERVSADTGIHTSTVRAWWRQREARTRETTAVRPGFRNTFSPRRTRSATRSEPWTDRREQRPVDDAYLPLQHRHRSR